MSTRRRLAIPVCFPISHFTFCNMGSGKEKNKKQKQVLFWTLKTCNLRNFKILYNTCQSLANDIGVMLPPGHPIQSGNPCYSLSLPHFPKTPIIIYNHMICLCLCWLWNSQRESSLHITPCLAPNSSASKCRQKRRKEGGRTVDLHSWDRLRDEQYGEGVDFPSGAEHQDSSPLFRMIHMEKGTRGRVHSLPYSVHSPRVYACMVSHSSPFPTTCFHVPHCCQRPSWEGKTMGPLHMASPSHSISGIPQECI